MSGWFKASILLHIYTLDTVLSHDDTTIEHQSRNIGIRSFVFNDKNELLINGEKTFLRGVNRHQEYPFVGYATSAQADMGILSGGSPA